MKKNYKSMKFVLAEIHTSSNKITLQYKLQDLFNNILFLKKIKEVTNLISI